MLLLSNYPPAVVERAAHPVDGIPSKIKFLNLAEITEYLDIWRDDFYRELEREERARRPKIAPPPEPSAEMRARLAKKMADLANHLRAS